MAKLVTAFSGALLCPEPGRRSALIFTAILAFTFWAKAQDLAIKEVWIVPLAHTDFGFTDQPSVTRELHRRYIDIALDATLRTRNLPEAARFRWTLESQYSFDDWWRSASNLRRNKFLAMVKAGQLDVGALADNATPYLDQAGWEEMTHWIPDLVWRRVQPQTGVQDDVNGFPRAGAMMLLDRGVHRLWTGINNDLGGAPQQAPSGFWWKMPDGRRMFVWLNIPYSEGYQYFHSSGWRHGPLPKAGDTLYRPPLEDELLPADAASLRDQRAFLVGKLQQLVARGYQYSVFILPFTNQWRLDNDPPNESMTDFVAAWNKAGLTPKLRIATATQATSKMEEIAGKSVPEYSGEFTDWWADGSMSSPASMAASRSSKRYLQQISSPLFGPLQPNAKTKIDELQRELVVFDEHSWGGGNSVALPYSLDSQGEFAEKSLHAYGAMAQAQFLLSQRVRSAFVDKGEGLYVFNTEPGSWSGWIRFPASAFRDKYQSAADAATGVCGAVAFENGISPWTNPKTPGDITPQNDSQTFADNVSKQIARIWIQDLPGNAFRRLKLSTSPCPATALDSAVSNPVIMLDEKSWPSSLEWPGMSSSLILPGFGGFHSVAVDGFAPRAKVHEIWGASTAEKRNELRDSVLRTIAAVEEEVATKEDTGKTIIYTQSLRHPSLGWAVRRLEIWKSEPRIVLDFKLYRRSSELPEAFFISFPLPVGNTPPVVSNAGVPFKPYQEQVPGSCKDYFAIDGWVDYETTTGHWIWATKDAPLVTFGEGTLLEKATEAPARTNIVQAMVFNNLWHTNFVGNAMGEMDFSFSLQWQSGTREVRASDLARTLVSTPVLLLNPDAHADPLYKKYIFQP
ncbi:MAG TPA: hypothetical protein VGN01_00110 [Acidobacteriaceae bacterium]